MRSVRSSRLTALVLTLSFTCLLTGPATARSTNPSSATELRSDASITVKGKSIKDAIKNQDGRNSFSPDELEEMRAALLELLAANSFAAPLSDKGQGRSPLGEDLAAIRIQVQQLSAADLTSLRSVLNPFVIRQKLQGAMERLNAGKTAGSLRSEAVETAGLPVIDYYCKGTADVLGISAPVSPGTLAAADDVFFVAEGVRDIAQNVCNQVLLGVNTRSACNITDALYLVAKALNQKYHFCDDEYSSSMLAATYGGISHLDTDIANGITTTGAAITAAKTAITDNATVNKNEVISNDNTNKDTIIANDNSNFLALTNTVTAALNAIISNANANKDELKNLLLRTQIEADLSVNDGQPFVGLYQIPASVCFPSFDASGLPAAFPQQCGLLDLVRSIVAQTIAKTGNDANALRSFDKADLQRSQGKYADAYKSYRKAYKEAVK